ncbi:MAG TPA: T9SS type A sorting domain-containing protein [Bacteroidales bacterium]|nr:T9SS type A sorting domain-containing protein [Bacteroidales bacterium]HRZ48258.1 T9SS type A sorting domain-containing protein [Bacteroidales bacterium]
MLVFSDITSSQGIIPPYQEGFDVPNPAWTTDTTIWQQGAPTASIIDTPWSGTGVYATVLNGDYPNNAETYLYSPSFDLSSFNPIDTIKLSFYHWMAVADVNDYGQVQYSTSGGLVWANLGFTYDPFGFNWYNTQLGGVHRFNYQNSGWMYSSYALEPMVFNGVSDVRFRFKFFSNQTSTSNGWAIDEFKLNVPPSPKVKLLQIDFPVNDTASGTILHVKTTFTNTGNLPQNNVHLDCRINNIVVNTETWHGTINPQDTIQYTFLFPVTIPAGNNSLCVWYHPMNIYMTSQSTCNQIIGLPNPAGNIYGNITIPGAVVGQAEVFLIEHDTIAGTLTAIDTLITPGNTGIPHFLFSNVQPGTYLIKAAMVASNPQYLNFMPSYHTSSLFWHQANSIQVVAGNATQANINLIPGTNPGGPGFIGGLISQGANKSPGDPLEGVLVMLLDVNNGDNPLAFNYTNGQGAFTFSNIPLGTYKVYTEIAGKTTFPNVVTLDAANPGITGIKIVVGSQVISGIEPGSPDTQPTVGQLQPNPAADLCLISLWQSSGSDLHIRITDLTGKTMREETRTLSAGKANLEIPVKQLPEGIYLITLWGENGWKTTRKLIRQD